MTSHDLPWTSDHLDALRDRAINLLKQNDLGSCTLPSRVLYPHQWNWDSAFAALGWIHIDPDRAWTELLALCSMAHPDGMIPHIAFAPGDGYFPGPEWWNAPRSLDGRRTSGITQPPVAAMCLKIVHDIAPRPDLLMRIAPALHAWHQRLMESRTTSTVREPIVVHGWESGRDNSIDFDHGMQLTSPTATKFERLDTRHVDAEHRPTDDEYRRYLGLVEYFRDELAWDPAALAKRSPIRVLDPLFSSTLARSCWDLASLLDDLGMHNEAAQERLWLDQLRSSLSARAGADGLVRAWIVEGEDDESPNGFEVSDVSCGSAMVLLIPDLPTELVQAARLLVSEGELASEIGVRSASTNAAGYNRRGYWRGPVWTNITWLCAHGARTHNLDELADLLDQRLISFVEQVGMREYAAPADDQSAIAHGLGADDFTWTAALLLHILSYNP